MRYKVQLQATVFATVYVEATDPQDAVEIAECAWKPRVSHEYNSGIDPFVEAITDWEVETHSDNTIAVSYPLELPRLPDELSADELARTDKNKDNHDKKN